MNNRIIAISFGLGLSIKTKERKANDIKKALARGIEKAFQPKSFANSA